MQYSPCKTVFSVKPNNKIGTIFVPYKTKVVSHKHTCAMKKIGYVLSTLLLAATAAGCSSAYYSSAGYAADDLYAIHDKTAIAQRKQAEAEAAKAEAEARRAQWEARLAEAEASAAERQYYAAGETSESYGSVLADTYESAYARRLRGFTSPTYRMPSSYYNFRYGSTFNYVSAYDPAFYNVMVMGDEVWVEPKYVTSMFGTWGRPAVYVDPWYYGWNYSPYHYGGWSFSVGSWGWGFGWNYSWYDPWYGPGYRPGYHPGWGPGWNSGWGPGWHGPGGPHYAGYRRPYNRNIVHRADPNTPPSGVRYGSPAQRVGSGSSASSSSSYRNGGGSGFGVRNNTSSSGSNRQQTAPSRGGSGGNSSSGSSYRNSNTGSNSYNRGGSYNSGSSSRSGSSGYSSSSGSSGSRSSGGSYRNAGGR